jgi:hypothetical protein
LHFSHSFEWEIPGDFVAYNLPVSDNFCHVISSFNGNHFCLVWKMENSANIVDLEERMTLLVLWMTTCGKMWNLCLGTQPQHPCSECVLYKYRWLITSLSFISMGAIGMFFKLSIGIRVR